MAELSSLTVKLLRFCLNRPAEDVEYSLNFFAGSTPVLGGERPQCEVPDSEFAGSLGDPPDILGTGFVSLKSRHATLTGPATVSVHNDGDVLRNTGRIWRSCQLVQGAGDRFSIGG